MEEKNEASLPILAEIIMIVIGALFVALVVYLHNWDADRWNKTPKEKTVGAPSWKGMRWIKMESWIPVFKIFGLAIVVCVVIRLTHKKKGNNWFQISTFPREIIGHISHIWNEKEEMKIMEATTTKKWLHRFGTFLMMGGWILMALLFLVLTIVYYHFFPYTK